MEDFMNEMAAEAAASPAPEKDPATLASVQAMAAKSAALQKRIDTGEELLKKLKAEQYELTTKHLPTDMLEIKTPLMVVDGYKIECKPYVKANIAADDPEDKRERAFAWLESNDGGDIVNNVVTAAFPKEKSKEAREFYEDVKKRFDNQRDVEVVMEKKVPWNRLTKWLKEFIKRPAEPGQTKPPIPVEDLNATIGNVVSVTKMSEFT